MSNSVLRSAMVPREGPVLQKILEILGGEPSTGSAFYAGGAKGFKMSCQGGGECAVLFGPDPGIYRVAWAENGEERVVGWRAVVTWEPLE